MYRKDLVKSYSTPPAPGNPREVEAWALTQVALRMKAAQESKDPEAMNAAVRLNWQLWTIIQADLLDSACPLPPDIRANALSLANFIDKHTVEFFSNPIPAALGVLININRELAGGLFQKPPGSDPTASGKDQMPPPAGTSGMNTTA